MMLRFVLPLASMALAAAIALIVLGVRRRRWGYFLGAGGLVLLLGAGYFLLITFITSM